MKTNVCCTVDVDVIAEARRLELPISRLINEFLKGYLQIHVKEPDDNLDVEIATAKSKLAMLEKEAKANKPKPKVVLSNG